MTGTMKVGKLKKNAVYYYHKDYDERVGGAFIFFIMPMLNNDSKTFFYVTEISYLRQSTEEMQRNHPGSNRTGGQSAKPTKRYAF